jgi:hypothetical protein
MDPQRGLAGERHGFESAPYAKPCAWSIAEDDDIEVPFGLLVRQDCARNRRRRTLLVLAGNNMVKVNRGGRCLHSECIAMSLFQPADCLLRNCCRTVEEERVVGEGKDAGSKLRKQTEEVGVRNLSFTTRPERSREARRFAFT